MCVLFLFPHWPSYWRRSQKCIEFESERDKSTTIRISIAKSIVACCFPPRIRLVFSFFLLYSLKFNYFLIEHETVKSESRVFRLYFSYMYIKNAQNAVHTVNHAYYELTIKTYAKSSTTTKPYRFERKQLTDEQKRLQ